jgi:holin-like protein
VSRCTGCPTLFAHRNDDYCQRVNKFWHDGFHPLFRASLVAQHVRVRIEGDPMIKTFTVLLAYQCLGELIAYAGNLPIPGAVIGMILLLASLSLRPGLSSAIESDSLALLRFLPLLFVPAGVGIMVFAGRVAHDLLPIAVSVVVCTALTIIVTALVGQGLCALWSPRAAPLAPLTTPSASPLHADGNTAPAAADMAKVDTP